MRTTNPPTTTRPAHAKMDEAMDEEAAVELPISLWDLDKLDSLTDEQIDAMYAKEQAEMAGASERIKNGLQEPVKADGRLDTMITVAPDRAREGQEFAAQTITLKHGARAGTAIQPASIGVLERALPNQLRTMESRIAESRMAREYFLANHGVRDPETDEVRLPQTPEDAELFVEQRGIIPMAQGIREGKEWEAGRGWMFNAKKNADGFRYDKVRHLPIDEDAMSGFLLSNYLAIEAQLTMLPLVNVLVKTPMLMGLCLPEAGHAYSMGSFDLLKSYRAIEEHFLQRFVFKRRYARSYLSEERQEQIEEDVRLLAIADPSDRVLAIEGSSNRFFAHGVGVSADDRDTRHHDVYGIPNDVFWKVYRPEIDLTLIERPYLISRGALGSPLFVRWKKRIRIPGWNILDNSEMFVFYHRCALFAGLFQALHANPDSLIQGLTELATKLVDKAHEKSGGSFDTFEAAVGFETFQDYVRDNICERVRHYLAENGPTKNAVWYLAPFPRIIALWVEDAVEDYTNFHFNTGVEESGMISAETGEELAEGAGLAEPPAALTGVVYPELEECWDIINAWVKGQYRGVQFRKLCQRALNDAGITEDMWEHFTVESAWMKRHWMMCKLTMDMNNALQGLETGHTIDKEAFMRFMRTAGTSAKLEEADALADMPSLPLGFARELYLLAERYTNDLLVAKELFFMRALARYIPRRSWSTYTSRWGDMAEDIHIYPEKVARDEAEFLQHYRKRVMRRRSVTFQLYHFENDETPRVWDGEEAAPTVAEMMHYYACMCYQMLHYDDVDDTDDEDSGTLARLNKAIAAEEIFREYDGVNYTPKIDEEYRKELEDVVGSKIKAQIAARAKSRKRDPEHESAEPHTTSRRRVPEALDPSSAFVSDPGRDEDMEETDQ